MGLFGSFNKVVVMGNMTRDAEVRTLPSGTQVADIAIAVNDRVKKGDEWVDEATFVDITAFNKAAEWLQRFGGKGKTVLIEGRLRQEKWVDKQSGQNRTKMKVVADNVTFVDGSGGGGGGGGGGSQRRSGAAAGGGAGRGRDNGGGGGYDRAPAQDDMPYRTGFDEDEGDHIPF